LAQNINGLKRTFGCATRSRQTGARLVIGSSGTDRPLVVTFA